MKSVTVPAVTSLSQAKLKTERDHFLVVSLSNQCTGFTGGSKLPQTEQLCAKAAVFIVAVYFYYQSFPLGWSFVIVSNDKTAVASQMLNHKEIIKQQFITFQGCIIDTCATFFLQSFLLSLPVSTAFKVLCPLKIVKCSCLSHILYSPLLVLVSMNSTSQHSPGATLTSLPKTHNAFFHPRSKDKNIKDKLMKGHSVQPNLKLSEISL